MKHAYMYVCTDIGEALHSADVARDALDGEDEERRVAHACSMHVHKGTCKAAGAAHARRLRLPHSIVPGYYSSRACGVCEAARVVHQLLEGGVLHAVLACAILYSRILPHTLVISHLAYMHTYPDAIMRIHMYPHRGAPLARFGAWPSARAAPWRPARMHACLCTC